MKGSRKRKNSILSNVNQSLSADIASKMVIVLLLLASRLKNEKDEIKLSMTKTYLLISRSISNEADQIKKRKKRAQMKFWVKKVNLM